MQNSQLLECVSLRKSEFGFLNPKESENRFWVSLLERSIQDSWDHCESKEPKNPLWKWILRFLPHHDPGDFGLIYLVTKHKLHLRILSDLKIQCRIFLKKRTLSLYMSKCSLKKGVETSLWNKDFVLVVILFFLWISKLC